MGNLEGLKKECGRVVLCNECFNLMHSCPMRSGGLSFSEKYGMNSTKLPRYLEQEGSAHLALMVGDLSYALGEVLSRDSRTSHNIGCKLHLASAHIYPGYAADWDYFGQQFERSFTMFPLAVGMGNHERDWPSTGDAFGDMASDSGEGR